MRRSAHKKILKNSARLINFKSFPPVSLLESIDGEMSQETTCSMTRDGEYPEAREEKNRRLACRLVCCGFRNAGMPAIQGPS